MDRTFTALAFVGVMVTGCADVSDQTKSPEVAEDPDEALPSTEDADTAPAPSETAPAPSETASAPSEPAEAGPLDDDTNDGAEPMPSQAPPSVQPFYPAGDVDNGLTPFIDRARADLAERLGVDAAELSTRAAVLVTWSDSSLGCPQKGMQYMQVLTDGSVIELDHDGRTYRYHGGGSRDPFLCTPPATRAPARADGGGGGGDV